jgi:hypothetical protein
MSIFEILLFLTKRLYPTGRVFRVSKDSTIEKVHRGLIASEQEVYEAALDVLNSILPDNDFFTEEDATNWERRLAIRSNQFTDLEDRKLAILRKYESPGDIPARQHYLYLERALNQVGFEVFVFEQTKPVPTPPANLAFYTGASTIQLGQGIQLGQLEAGGIEVDLIANFIDEERDKEFIPGADLKHTFFVGGQVFGEGAEVPAARRDEFRQLILQVKPLQTVGFLLINYVPSFIMIEEQQVEFLPPEFAANDYCFGCNVVENYLYVHTGSGSNTGSFLIYDLSVNPQNPVFVKDITNDFSALVNDISGVSYLPDENILIVTNGSSNSRYVFLDVSDPVNPVELGASLATGNFTIRSQHLYDGLAPAQRYIFSHYTGFPNLGNIEWADPANTTITNINSPGSGGTFTTALSGKGRYLFKGERPGDGVLVLDVEGLGTPNAPELLYTSSASLVNSSRIFRNLLPDLSRNLLFGILDSPDDDGTGVVVFDMTDPSVSLPVVGKLLMTGATSESFFYSAKRRSNFLAVMSSDGLYVWDVRDISLANDRLEIFTQITDGGNCQSWEVFGNFAYIPKGRVGEGITIVPHEIIT